MERNTLSRQDTATAIVIGVQAEHTHNPHMRPASRSDALLNPYIPMQIEEEEQDPHIIPLSSSRDKAKEEKRGFKYKMKWVLDQL